MNWENGISMIMAVVFIAAADWRGCLIRTRVCGEAGDRQ